MRKWGTALHILITAGVGVLFFIIGELLFPILTEIIWAPLGIALYFALFAGAVYGVMFLLNKKRGDYQGWHSKNLGEVVSGAFKKGAIAIAVIFLASGILEFVYELNISTFTMGDASSYVFVIDDSGSMEISDPDMKRADAISEIMEKEDADFEFAIYRFTHEVFKIRDMAPYQKGEQFAFEPTGGTDVVAALRMAVDDIISGELKAGSTPKILLLSDGASDDSGLNAVISDCCSNNIVISTISFGFSSPMLAEIANRTGGMYSEVTDVNLLSQEMESAITFSSSRNLLSNRFVFSNDWVYMIMRIAFLVIIGIGFSWLKQKCYCSAYDHGYQDKVFLVSAILCSVGAILVEVFFKLDLFGSYWYAYGIRLIFCILWAISPGFFVSGVGNFGMSSDQYSVYRKNV
ncbi:MAG: VWA domain-containing protein [Clostridia bacterium]|nr:VWA domain-containing protein [Clostridia bacterium]